MSTPAASGVTRRRADAVRNRQRVLGATKTLLAEGRATLTVDAISRKAGVGTATVVRTFGSKEALIDAAVAELLEPLVQRGRDALLEPDAEQALRGFLVEVIAFQSTYWIMGERLGEMDLPATTAQRAALNTVGLDLITRARDDGAIRTDIDASVVTVLIGEVTYAVARSQSASPALSESYVSVIMDGLRPQQSRP
ncbi:TetR/AcrR family transcriptional regulator [Micromonospora sp. NPDC048839]|uniref:TetR/AcrR family transcriptional regulator n=1 Tax=Micromonospora sp. NPDC048839 TaxID=3155641 RepID=UPI0033CDA7B1